MGWEGGGEGIWSCGCCVGLQGCCSCGCGCCGCEACCDSELFSWKTTLTSGCLSGWDRVDGAELEDTGDWRLGAPPEDIGEEETGTGLLVEAEDGDTGLLSCEKFKSDGCHSSPFCAARAFWMAFWTSTPARYSSSSSVGLPLVCPLTGVVGWGVGGDTGVSGSGVGGSDAPLSDTLSKLNTVVS